MNVMLINQIDLLTITNTSIQKKKGFLKFDAIS